MILFSIPLLDPLGYQMQGLGLAVVFLLLVFLVVIMYLFQFFMLLFFSFFEKYLFMLIGWAYDDVQFIWSFMLNKLILESIVVFLSYNPSLFLNLLGILLARCFSCILVHLNCVFAVFNEILVTYNKKKSQ